MSSPRAPIAVAVLAHNEERRIACCLESLPLGRDDVAIHVVVNGSTDGTARIAREIAARAGNVVVHDYKEGGKSRSWNRFVFDTLPSFHDVHVFVDGDAELTPGSVDALARCLARNQGANAASGLPCNGRRVDFYRAEVERTHGMFGDLYALRGSFLAAMKQAGVRLPDDLIGDDGLIGAMAKTNLGPESGWDDSRIVTCHDAGFLCEPVSPWSVRALRMQWSRMVNYSVRHFQNQMISPIMREQGPSGLPRLMRSLYPALLPGLRPRRSPQLWWFDRAALQRMRTQKPVTPEAGR